MTWSEMMANSSETFDKKLAKNINMFDFESSSEILN